MGKSPRARRKVQSSNAKTSRKVANRKKKHAAPLSTGVPEILLPHWSATATLRENYQNWGLVARLNGSAGGVKGGKKQAPSVYKHEDVCTDEFTELDYGRVGKPDSELTMLGADGARKTIKANLEKSSSTVEEATVVRDEHGNIVSITEIKPVLRGSCDQVAEIEQNSIVRALEEHSANGIHNVFRKQCGGEREFVVACTTKYAKEYNAMSRDLKLNVNQLTPNQIRRKIEKYERDMK